MTLENQNMYDKKRLVINQINQFLLWPLMFGVGFLLSYCIHQILSIIILLF